MLSTHNPIYIAIITIVISPGTHHKIQKVLQKYFHPGRLHCMDVQDRIVSHLSLSTHSHFATGLQEGKPYFDGLRSGLYQRGWPHYRNVTEVYFLPSPSPKQRALPFKVPSSYILSTCSSHHLHHPITPKTLTPTNTNTKFRSPGRRTCAYKKR